MDLTDPALADLFTDRFADEPITGANLNRAPYQTPLAEMVANVAYKDGWQFHLRHMDRDQGSVGLTLDIWIDCPDSYNPGRVRRVSHRFPVPPAAFGERAWRRWLFDRIVDVERHEAMEFYRYPGAHTDWRPYAPHHGDGEDPYQVFEHAPPGETERRPGQG